MRPDHMRPTGLVLVVMVVVVVIMAMANNDSSADADEPDAQLSTGASNPRERLHGALDLPNRAAFANGNAGVSLTFDDGPHPEYTPQVLDILAAHGVRAVFCVVGENAHAHPDLVRRVVADGHALCNHSYSHDARLRERSPDAIADEITTTTAAILEAAPDAQVAYFRQPAMHVTSEVAPIAEEEGLAILDWTIDAHDWKRPGAAKIAARVRDGLEPGAVILLHDGGGDRSQTVAALPRIIADIEAAGHAIRVPSLRPSP